MSLPPGAPRSVHTLLQRLSTEDPTSPRLTYYAGDYARSGERIELSARVLSTWVAKTANLLEEEFDAGPGSRIGLDLPTHWRTLIWQLAVWATGAAVTLSGPQRFAAHDENADDKNADDENGDDENGDDVNGDDVNGGEVNGTLDVAVSCRLPTLAATAAAGTDTVAVSLAPLATSFGSQLPVGVLDYARVVTGYGDLHSAVADPLITDPALITAAQTVPHGALLQKALEAGAGWPVGVRLLTDATPAMVVRSALAAWMRGGSVVITPGLAALPGSIGKQERVSAVLAR